MKNAQVTLETIWDRMETLNNLYGRGKIVSIDCMSCKVECKKQYGTEFAKYRIVGNTLYFRGHQSRLDKEYRI